MIVNVESGVAELGSKNIHTHHVLLSRLKIVISDDRQM